MTQSRWHEDQEFWREVGPLLFSSERREAAPEEAEALWELLELREGAEVLDLACGMGIHAIELARMGCRVTGVDRSAGYLQSARDNAGAAGVEAEWVEADAREFVRPGAFEGAINLFTSFGYFERAEDNERVLRNVYESLKGGGRFVMELMGKEQVARDFLERDEREIDGIRLVEERRVVDGWRRIWNRWTIEREGRRSEVEFTHWVYSAAELTEMLERAGFGRVEAYGDFWRGEYDDDADSLVMVAVKD